MLGADYARDRWLQEGGHPGSGSGASLTPKLEAGLRHDDGDAETGFGVELGGGLAWVDPRLGLSLDLSGRRLVTHGADDLEDRGFAAFDRRFTGSPHIGLGIATGERDYTLGWRLTPEAGGLDLGFGVTATRRESDEAPPQHGIGVQLNTRW